MSEDAKKLENLENAELTDEQMENISGGYIIVPYEDPNKDDKQ